MSSNGPCWDMEVPAYVHWRSLSIPELTLVMNWWSILVGFEMAKFKCMLRGPNVW